VGRARPAVKDFTERRGPLLWCAGKYHLDFGVLVGLGVLVGRGVLVVFGVLVGCAVFVGSGVLVGCGVLVGRGVLLVFGVLVAVAVGCGVLVGVLVAVRVGVFAGVLVAVAVGIGVEVAGRGVLVGAAGPAEPFRLNRKSEPNDCQPDEQHVDVTAAASLATVERSVQLKSSAGLCTATQ
jgi:hypothetical protein